MGEPVRFFCPGEDKADNFKSLCGSFLTISLWVTMLSLSGSLFIDKFIFGPNFDISDWKDIQYWGESMVATSEQNFKIAFAVTNLAKIVNDQISPVDESIGKVTANKVTRSEKGAFIYEEIPIHQCTSDDFSFGEEDNKISNLHNK